MSHTFVLVHGAWLGGWCWRDVATILRAAGHRVLTPTLTGLDSFRVNGTGALNYQVRCRDASGNTSTVLNTTGACATGQTLVSAIPPFTEEYFGNSAKPRVSVGFGINWNSPFGPFRIDIAKALLKEPGDDTKLFSFNVGTQF